MLAFEIVPALAVLRVLTRQVLDMVLRAVIDLLLMDSNGAVTVRAPDILGGRADCFRNPNFLPVPLILPITFVLGSPFANRH